MAASMPTVVAWSWGADQYHTAAARLQQQLEEYGIPHRIRMHADLDAHFARQFGEWKPVVWAWRYAPTFLLQELEAGPEDLLYLHADMRIRKPIPPEAFDCMDIGLQERWVYKPDAPLRLLAAPMFVRNNEASRRFLRLWNAECMNLDDGGSEHWPLFRTFQLMQRWDRTLTCALFNPPLGSKSGSADCPITGDKP